MIEKLDNTLKEVLQDYIEIKSKNNGKYLRKGVLQLYSIKEFYINIILKTVKGDTKNYFLPFPYSFELTPTKLIFDYRLQLIHNGHQHVIELLEAMGESRSPFYDNVIELIRVNPTSER